MACNGYIPSRAKSSDPVPTSFILMNLFHGAFGGGLKVKASVAGYFCPAKIFSSAVSMIIVVHPSVHPSITDGQWKRFDLETPVAVSWAVVRRKLELGDLCER